MRPENAGIDITATAKGGSADILYTVPNNHIAEVVYLSISNTTAGAEDITVEIYKASTISYLSLVEDYELPANNALSVVGAGEVLVLNPGDRIVCSNSSGIGLTAFVSLKLYFKQVN